MDAALINVARTCQQASYSGAMSFPQIVGRLMAAGFESYLVDYRRNATTYYLPDGGSVVLDNPRSDVPVAAEFDQPGIAAQIRWAQANPPDYAYEGFSKNVKAMGCAGYIVSFSGRRALYFGRSAETHVEMFPD